MSRNFGGTVGIAVIILCIAASAGGLALLGKAYTMPAHVNEATAQALSESYESEYPEMSLEDRERKAREIASTRTGKWLLRNTGVSICLTSLMLAVAIVRFRLWDIRNLGTATTPQSRLRLVALATLAWMVLIPAGFLELQDEYIQDDLRPHNDFGQGIFLVLGIPAILIFSVFATFLFSFLIIPNANLPANLWCLDASKPYRNAGLSIFYGALVGLLAIVIGWSAANFPWAIPSEMLGIYVFLSTRAGLLNREDGPPVGPAPNA